MQPPPRGRQRGREGPALPLVPGSAEQHPASAAAGVKPEEGWPPPGASASREAGSPGTGAQAWLSGDSPPRSQVAPQVFARRDLAGSSHREERLIGISHPPVAGRGRLAGGHDILPRFPCPWPGSLWHLGAPCRGHCLPEVPGSGQLCAFLPPPLMVWASQATSRCQGDTGTPEFVGSDGRTTAQVTWENAPAAPAGGRGTAGRPRLAGDERALGVSGQGRAGEGTSAVCCHRTTPRGARHQRGGRGLRAGLRHPTSGAPRGPGPPLAPATGALAQHSARWLPGPRAPGGATRLGSTWAPPGSGCLVRKGGARHTKPAAGGEWLPFPPAGPA